MASLSEPRIHTMSVMKDAHIQEILVPIDFSKMSIEGIEAAKRLGQRFGATIHLGHVYELPYPAEFMAPTLPVMVWPAAFRAEDEQRLAERLTALAAKHGLSATGTCHVRSGPSTFKEICLLAKELSADLIVMPTHGYKGLKHILLGSTAERVVQHSPCPVLVTRESRRSGRQKISAERPVTIDQILAPVDFSGCSLDGLNYAIQFADRFAAKIIVLHTVYLPYSYSGDGRTMVDPSVVLRAAQKGAEKQMREFVRAAKFGGVKFETRVIVGPSADEICAAAKGYDVDLIVTSTHGRTGFKHVLIGSTAEHLVRYAPCPVLVVPSHPAIRAASLSSQKAQSRKAGPRTASPRALKPKRLARENLTSRARKLKTQAFPERRKTNKFRESHAGSASRTRSR
jgi:nucleotide-binding universal stress UspA family protein